MALKKLGYSLNSTDPDQVRQARDLLLRQKPLVKGYNSSNFEQDLAAGDAWIAQAYNGNMTFVMRDEPRIGYVIPKEGGTISVDCACIPRHAPHPQLAEDFINYFHRPEVAARFGVDGRAHIDLTETVRRQLEAAGVDGQRIYVSGLCTKCRAGEFHSFRRDGAAAGRLYSFAGIRETGPAAIASTGLQ